MLIGLQQVQVYSQVGWDAQSQWPSLTFKVSSAGGKDRLQAPGTAGLHLGHF